MVGRGQLRCGRLGLTGAPRAWRATADCVFDATALQATVPRIARPIDPPTCCPVLSSDDATPASLFGTFASATSDSGTKISPMPSAGQHHRPEQPARVRAVSVSRDSQNMPPAASAVR